LHLRLALLFVLGWPLEPLATSEHPPQPAPEPARGERLVDLAVCLRVSIVATVVVRCFGPDHSTHGTTLARLDGDF
jgi:hypothetical protein